MSLLDTFRDLNYSDLEGDAQTALDLLTKMGAAAAAIEKLFPLDPTGQRFITKLIALGADAQEFLTEFLGDEAPTNTAPSDTVPAALNPDNSAIS
jgi:hypothetical protein